MKKLSISTDNVNFEPIQVSSLTELAELITKQNVCVGTFRDNYRNKSNFQQADFIHFDVDDGRTIEECKNDLDQRGYSYVIGHSRNHQKLKNGKVCDRFHVYIPLEESISDIKIYKNTYNKLKEELPYIDKSCSDASRQFFPCKSIETIKKGSNFPVYKETSQKLELVNLTKIKEGTRNSTFVAIAGALRRYGLSEDMIFSALQGINQNHTDDPLPQEEVETIASTVSTYDAEEIIEDEDFEGLSELSNRTEELNWIVDQFLFAGGISIMAGPPKEGKSTLMRQLAAAIATGEKEFIGRKIQNGKVLYIALEEHPAAIVEQYNKMGVKDHKNLKIWAKPVRTSNKAEWLYHKVKDHQPKLVVIDTMNEMTQIEDLNSHKATYDGLRPYREIATEFNCHIVFIHHTNKSLEYFGVDAILGSRGLVAAVDAACVINRAGQEKYSLVSSRQRLGDAFNKFKIDYNPKTDKYTVSNRNRVPKLEDF